MGKGAAGRNHAAPTCLRKQEQPEGTLRKGEGKETLQEIRRRPHVVGPSSRSVQGQVPVSTGTNCPWTGHCSECMIPYQKATTGGTNATRVTTKGTVGNERNGLSEGER
jgi:hypothetical protein